MKNPLYAIFNPFELENFLKRFKLDIEDCFVSFVGWNKHTIMCGDKVFLFPRNPSKVPNFNKEIRIYQKAINHPQLLAPRLIELVNDKRINYYPFAVVSKFNGQLLTKYLKDINNQQMKHFLLQLTKKIAAYHEIDIAEFPFLNKRLIQSRRKLLIKKWQEDILSLLTFEKTFHQTFTWIEANFNKLSIKLGATWERKKQQIYTILQEIASLDRVLIHGDIHEDQIFVMKKEDELIIEGIIDWETATVFNPILDFNFGEWGIELWEFEKKFSEWRKQIWHIYQQERNIQLKSDRGLDVFYKIQEFVCLLNEEKHQLMNISKEELEKKMFNKLREIRENL